MKILLAILVLVAVDIFRARARLISVRQGTSGGPQPDPGEPGVTPTAIPPRNDFAAFAGLGGYTGGVLGVKSVDPVLVDPANQAINTSRIEAELNDILFAGHRTLGPTDPAAGVNGQSSAQTPENWTPAPLDQPTPARMAPADSLPLSPVPSSFRMGRFTLGGGGPLGRGVPRSDLPPVIL
jgi:hypothetical protein